MNFSQYLFHSSFGFSGDDAFTSYIVAVFSGVGDGVTHFSHATFIHQVNDKFHFVHAFKVSTFRSVASFNEGFITSGDEGSYAAAQYSLFTKEVSFGFFTEGGFQSASAGTANTFSISQSKVKSFTGSILVSSYQYGNTATFYIGTTNEMARTFRSNHEYVDASRRNDLVEVNVEAVSECQSVARFQIRFDIFVISCSLFFVRNKNHYYVSNFSSFCSNHNFQTCSFSFCPGFGAFVQTNYYVYATFLQVQCMSVTLRTVTNDSNGFTS